MNLQEAVQQLITLYPRIFFACHTRHVQDPDSKEKLSSHQASILDHLDEIEPLSLRDLARHLGVTPSTMSIAVGRLIRKGYVLRTRDPNDARRINIRLSRAGARLREAKSVLDPELVENMLRHLTPEQRQEAIRGLAQLANAAQKEMHNRSSAKADSAA